MALTQKSANRKDISTANKGVEMQHRHYAAIAAIIRDIEADVMRGVIADHFADGLRATNPKFDRARFIAACQA